MGLKPWGLKKCWIGLVLDLDYFSHLVPHPLVHSKPYINRSYINRRFSMCPSLYCLFILDIAPSQVHKREVHFLHTKWQLSQRPTFGKILSLHKKIWDISIGCVIQVYSFDPIKIVVELVHFTEFASPSIPMMIGLNIFEKFIKSMLITDDCPLILRTVGANGALIGKLFTFYWFQVNRFVLLPGYLGI